MAFGEALACKGIFLAPIDRHCEEAKPTKQSKAGFAPLACLPRCCTGLAMTKSGKERVGVPPNADPFRAHQKSAVTLKTIVRGVPRKA